MSHFCYRCGEEWTGAAKPSRSDICPKCGAMVRCCRNCQYYDPHAHNQCHIPESEYVGDKERANFCEWFILSEGKKGGSGGKQTSREDDARKKWDKLFRDD